MNLPNFILAGFPKCGSTSLYYYLFEHPEIYLPSQQKELHYFTYDNLAKRNKGKGDSEIIQFYMDSFKAYKNCFANVTNQKVIGDVSPSYSNYEECIPKIKDTLGENTKVIFILRDPVQRAYSNYLHLVRENREKLSFMDALREEQNRMDAYYSDFWYYTFNSTYLPKINTMKKHLKNILVVTFEEFVQNPEKGIKEIYGFLGVDEDFVPTNLETTFNPGGAYKKNFITRFIFSQHKFKSALKKTFPMTMEMKKAKIWLIEKYRKNTPPMPQDAEDFLAEMFKEDVRILKEEFGVKTELWNEKLHIEKKII